MPFRRTIFMPFVLAVLIAAGSAAAAAGADDATDVAAVQGLLDPGLSPLPATGVSDTGALLQAYVDARGTDTDYYFEYGTTTVFGLATPKTAAGSTYGWVQVSARLDGLLPATTYHYRAVAKGRDGKSKGPTQTFTTSAAGTVVAPPAPGEAPDPAVAPPPVAPTLGATVGLAPRSGDVRVKAPEGERFVTLSGSSEVPDGSEIDAREGSVALTASLPSGTTQTGRFGDGRFVVRQGEDGYVDLHLRGRACVRRAAASAGAVAVASARRRSVRRLWGRDHGGRFRTHGKHSHATVRGTRWTVVDRCDGTLTRVREGSVVVRDTVRDRRVIVRAGQRYLARRP